MTTTVTIFGPNLRDQSKGLFHVHAAGCSHSARYAYLAPWDSYDIEASCVEDVVRDVYSCQMSENEGVWATPAAYLDDFHFAPCADLGSEIAR